MTLGRTSSGAVKIKTDGGLRAVECGCCETGPCNFPPVCLEGFPNSGWSGDENGCSTGFLDIPDCTSDPPVIINDPFFAMFCGSAKWALLLTGTCIGNGGATNFYCKNDGIDSPIGTYYGYNYGGDGFLTFTVTEKFGESC